MASDDPRAVSLYVRTGFVPRWPIYELEFERSSSNLYSFSRLSVEPAPIDNSLVALDGQASGRLRPADIQFWQRDFGARAILIKRNGSIIGYAILQDWVSSRLAKWFDGDPPVFLGPLGVNGQGNVAPAIGAAVSIALDLNPRVRLAICGPNPGLPQLLRSGARVLDASTFMASEIAPFGDPQLYLPSGSLLL